MAGQLAPSHGRVTRSGPVHYLAQQTVSPALPTVAALAGMQAALSALERIEQGSADPADFDAVGKRWDIRNSLQTELDRNGLAYLRPDTPAAILSGGEAMRVALIAAWLSDATMLILDEPSNHLDHANRAASLAQLQRWPGSLLVISHDRELLGQMERIVELSPLGLRSYGGDYALYAECKRAERDSAQRLLDQRKLERKRTRLAQMGIDAQMAAAPVATLSGGERLKVALACVLYAHPPAQLLLLDEPSNHLDLVSLAALETMLGHYQGALLVVSHDDAFMQALDLTHVLEAGADGWRLRQVAERA